MKKSFAVVFAISILLSFVGCGKENTETSSKIQSKTESKISSNAESNPESKTESKMSYNAESNLESKAESKMSSNAESNPESKAESKISSNAEPNLESKAESKHDKLSADSVSNKTKIPETNITFDSNYAFLGNSLFGDLDEYELVDNADVYSYIGMNVATVFDQKLDKHKKPMLDEMLSKDYKTIFIMFGMNEVGWSYPDIFTDDYAELGEDGMNSEAIAKFNKLIQKVAKEHNASYLNVNSYLKNEYGFLDEDDSPDGCHLQPNAYLRMVNAIKYLIL